MSINAQNFNKRLSGLIRSAKNQREQVQEFIAFGLEHYKGNGEEGTGGDATYLTQLLQACVGVKSLPTRTMVAYIKEHAPTLQWGKAKDGKPAFKKAEKGSDHFGTTILPEVTWYDWHKAQHNDVEKEYDAVARFKAFATNLKKAMDEGKVKDEEKAKIIQAKMDELGALLA